MAVLCSESSNGGAFVGLSLPVVEASGMLACMNQKIGTRGKEVQSGQIWRMPCSQLEVGLVGKHLVHYKLIKGDTKRTPTSLSAKKVVETYLKQNKAVLVHG